MPRRINNLAEFRENPSVEELLIMEYEVAKNDNNNNTGNVKQEVDEKKNENEEGPAPKMTKIAGGIEDKNYRDVCDEITEEKDNEYDASSLCLVAPALKSSPSDHQSTSDSPDPVPELSKSIPLYMSLQKCVKGGVVDMWSAASFIQQCVSENMNVVEQVRRFAADIASASVSPLFSMNLYNPANIHQFQCATILSEEMSFARLRVLEKTLKSRESGESGSTLIISGLKFNAVNFQKRHEIPASLDTNFRQGEIIDFRSVVLTNSKRVLIQLRNFLFHVLTRICNPPSAIQQYHHHSVKCSPAEEDKGTKQIPPEIVRFIQDMMLDSVALLHDLVESSFPPTVEEKKTDYFKSLGNNEEQRMKALQVARHNRRILLSNFIPQKLSETLREMRHSSFVEVAGRMRCIRRSHKSTAAQQRENVTVNE